MRAVQIDSHGSVDVLEVREVPPPDLPSDGVVVEVLASSINPGEAKIREGMPGADDQFPMGEGSDLAGRIVAVGEAVSGWSVGDEVIGWSGERSAHAQLVAVPATQLARKPSAVSWQVAGSLYVAGGTAWVLRDAAKAESADTVVVTAAAGGVGIVLVQLLVHAGVRVLGVAGGENAEFLQGLGAEPVPYGDDLLARLRAAAPDGVAAFLDCYGEGYTDLALELGVPKDKVATIADFGAAGQNGTNLVLGYQTVDAAVLGSLASLVADESLRVPIVGTFPLEQVRDAYTLLDEGHTHGKIVLLPAGEA
jgi:NADPH2:quinone reductase